MTKPINNKTSKPKAESKKKTTDQRLKDLEQSVLSLHNTLSSLDSTIDSFYKSISMIETVSERANKFIETHSKIINDAVDLAKRCNIKVNSNMLSFKDQLDTVVVENTANSAQIASVSKAVNILVKTVADMSQDIPLVHQEMDIIKSLAGITSAVDRQKEKPKKEKKNGNPENPGPTPGI